MINLNSGNVPKSQESNRQKELFSLLCSDQEQGRPGLLFRADGVLLTDDRKEAKKAPEQAASILFIKHH